MIPSLLDREQVQEKNADDRGLYQLVIAALFAMNATSEATTPIAAAAMLRRARRLPGLALCESLPLTEHRQRFSPSGKKLAQLILNL